MQSGVRVYDNTQPVTSRYIGDDSPPIDRANPPFMEILAWLDSASLEGGWATVDEAREQVNVQEIRTVGWVIHENKHRLLVAASHSDDWSQVGEVIAIPVEAVIHRRKTGLF